MSFTDRLIVWFHIVFVIFAIGPVTIATMSTPRYIRTRNLVVLRYLSRMTRIFGAASLGVLLFGIIGGQSLHEMTKSWVTASMTLFVVALVMLLLIMRDQHRAIVALEGVEVPVVSGSSGQPAAPDPTGAKDDEPGPRSRRVLRRASHRALPWPPSSGAGSPPWPAWSASSGW